MSNAQRRSARATFAATFGDSRFDEDDVQRDLGFNKDGDVIFDRLLQPPIEYAYPSAMGSQLFFEGTYKPGEIALLNMILSRDQQPIVLDIGANVGVHAVAWASAHPQAQVFAFEPSAAALAVLRRNADRVSRLTVVAAAVGDRPGRAPFEGGDVEVVTIDGFVTEHGLAKVSAMKIDVSGTERAVLAGAENVLRTHRPALLVEFESQPDGEPEKAIAEIVEFGYKPFAIVDGFIVPYTQFVRAFSSMLFIDVRQRVMLPPYPGPASMLAETAARIETIRKLSTNLARFQASSDVVANHDVQRGLEAAQAKIAELERICDERLRVIGELNFALSKERRANAEQRAASAAVERTTADVESLRGEVALLLSICHERSNLIERLAAELRAARATAEERGAEIAMLTRELREAETTIEIVRERVEALAAN